MNKEPLRVQELRRGRSVLDKNVLQPFSKPLRNIVKSFDLRI